jgi:hydroxyacylglutathione hydrolase
MPRVDARARDLVEVAPGVWTATAGLWTSLTTLVVGDDGSCLVVDPGITVDEVDALAASIDSRGWRVTAGFCTHPHWDHLLWADSLGDVPRWATAPAAAAAASGHADIVAKAHAAAPGHDESLLGRVVALPDGAGEVSWTGPRAVVVPHAGHAVGHAGLVLPHARVLVAGDMLSDLEIPLLDPAGADPVADYRTGLDLLEAAAKEHGVTTLIPGHGHVGDARELERRLAADRAYLDALVAGRTPDDPRLTAP